MGWYDTGTISVTNGTTAVTGSGTQFISGAQVGEAMLIDNVLYEIQSIVSATSITLADNYLGSSQSGLSYKIIPTQSLVADLSASVTSLISDYSTIANNAGAGKFNDGTVTSPGIQFLQDSDNGLFRVGSNNWGLVAGGSKIVDVSSTGIDVTGTATMDGLTVDTAQGSISIPTNTSSLNFNRAGSSYIRATDSAGSFTFITGANNFATQRLNIANNGDISFYEDTGTTPKFFWDASAESLGIGTSSPSAPLHISKAATGVNAATTVLKMSSVDASTAQYVGFQTQRDNSAGQGLNILVTNVVGTVSEAMRIDPSGNVGIGTSSPNTPLNVVDNNSDNSLPTLGTASGVLSISNSANQYGLLGGVLQSSGDSWLQAQRTDGAATAYNILLNPVGGNVGIGTSSPQATLDISSGAGSDTFPILKLGPNSTFGHTVYDSASTGDLIVKRMVSGTETETIRLARASGNVGIGTSLPTSKLHLYKTGASDNTLIIQNGQDAYASSLALTANNDGGAGYNAITSSTSGASQHWKIWGGGSASTMAFSTGGTERMRIDSSGNVLVGTTQTDVGYTDSGAGASIDQSGVIQSARSSVNANLYLNKLDNDGEIINLRKDGITVGSIGSRAGLVTNIILDPRTDGAGLTGTTNTIEPIDETGTRVDDTIQLGSAATRFKDAYLSGGVYLGGTGAANKLDYYEEGTFTPTIVGSTTAGTGTYTIQSGKYVIVGKIIYVSIRLGWSAHTGAGGMKLAGLPNTSNSDYANLGVVYRDGMTVSSGHTVNVGVVPDGNYANILEISTGTDLTSRLALDTAVTDLSISGCYQIA